jgi:phosphatidylglycerophosphatase A
MTMPLSGKYHVWLATWCGAGFLKPGPGTWGSLLSIPPALLAFAFGGLGAFIAGIFFISVCGHWAAARFDAETAGHDNSQIVIDEAAGQWIALLPVFVLHGLSATGIILAFLAFRFFDIIKPWPVSVLDRNMKGATGVMADDMLAGVLAGFLTLLCLTGLHYAGFGFS